MVHFHSFACSCPIFQTLFIKDTLFPIVYSCLLCHRSIDPVSVGLFLCGDEDERLITRLENTQFDAANGIDDEDSFNNSPALGANSPWNSKPPSSQESKSENPTSQASQ